MPGDRPPRHARRDARERAVQFLYGLEFSNNDWQSALPSFWDSVPSRPPVVRYAERLIAGIQNHREAIDTAIAGAVENWSPERIARIERNILRVAIYEMQFREDVPPAIAIDEAVEIAKRFGTDEAPGFVNGVLDRVKKNLADAPRSD